MEGPEATSLADTFLIQSIRAGERLKDAFAAVSKSTGFTAGALESAYYSARAGEGVHHGNNMLTPAEDLPLVYAAEASSHTNFPLTRPQLCLALDLCGKEMGLTWVRPWVQRHREQLSCRTAKAHVDDRYSSSMFEEAFTWADHVEEFLKDHCLAPSVILNYD